MLLFSSEIRALLACPGVIARLNEDVLPELAFGYLSRPETMFVGIQKLAPGHALELSGDGELKIREYWDQKRDGEPEVRPKRFYVEGYRDLLEGAVAPPSCERCPPGRVPERRLRFEYDPRAHDEGSPRNNSDFCGLRR